MAEGKLAAVKAMEALWIEGISGIGYHDRIDGGRYKEMSIA